MACSGVTHAHFTDALVSYAALGPRTPQVMPFTCFDQPLRPLLPYVSIADRQTF